MKTIFITVFQGTEFRNIIRTDIYKELVANPDIRLVLFTDSETKKNYYKQEFNGPQVVYEVVESYKPHWTAPLFSFLKFHLIRTSTIDLKRRWQLVKGQNYLGYFFKLTFNRFFANRFSRSLVRLAARQLVNDFSFRRYFDQYQPDLVFLAHLFSDIETALLREAKRRAVVSVGLINSWDKLTARNMILLLPDKLLVHNLPAKRDAVNLADMPEQDITIVGIPHFDYHLNTKRSSLESFTKKAGLDSKKRFLVFCPAGKTFVSSDGAVLDLLDRALSDGSLPADLELIVRLPPNDTIDLRDTYQNKIIIQSPGRRLSMKRGIDWDMNAEDFALLSDTLFHAALLVTYPSTIVIDAAVFDKPVINLNLKFTNHQSTDWIYTDFDHCRALVKTGSLRVVQTKEELIYWIKTYLENPHLDKEGRAKIREEYCSFLDGRSGKRVAEFLLNLLK